MTPKFPQLHPDAPTPPEGLRPKDGVEYGCGAATCADCYEPDAPCAHESYYTINPSQHRHRCLDRCGFQFTDENRESRPWEGR